MSRRQVKKNTLDAVFGEDFYVPLPAAPPDGASAPELVLSVMDWDRLGRNELVGSARVVLARPGPGADRAKNYLSEGQQVVSRD